MRAALKFLPSQTLKNSMCSARANIASLALQVPIRNLQNTRMVRLADKNLHESLSSWERETCRLPLVRMLYSASWSSDELRIQPSLCR